MHLGTFAPLRQAQAAVDIQDLIVAQEPFSAKRKLVDEQCLG